MLTSQSAVTAAPKASCVHCLPRSHLWLFVCPPLLP
jgi:hypothetical protein